VESSGALHHNVLVELIRAAGGILWRETPSRRRLALVHRARKNDWSLPKGKLDPGETWQQAALREVAEETGCAAIVGPFAGAKLCVDRPRPKLVLYWHMQAESERRELADDVDDVAWLSRREALSRLDHDSDRSLLLRALAEEPRFVAGSRPALEQPNLRRLLVVDGRCADDEIRRALAIIARASGVAAGRAPAKRTSDSV
jgi:8-oxo-dGTP diphosphatase